MYACDDRFQLCHAPRRSGKSEGWKRKIVKMAYGHTHAQRGKYVYACPTRDQAKRIAWNDLKALCEGIMEGRPSETELSIPLWNADLFVVGMDKPERVEGEPIDGIVLDEYANMKKDAWTVHIRPALSTPGRLGWAAFIGVPEGRNHYYRLKLQFEELGRKVWWWPASQVVDPAELEDAKRDMTDLEFQQEYEGDFITFEGIAYYTWKHALNVKPCRDRYDPLQPLIVMLDFNVAPGVASIGQELETGLFGLIGEVWIPRNSNTPAVCRKIIADWGEHQGRVLMYGDATGGARGTAKVQGSDWDLVKQDLGRHFGNRLRMMVPKANPRERARINAVCRMLRTADDKVHMIVDPTCVNTIADFEGTVLLAGGSGELDKKHDPDRTHMTDAIGYYAHIEHGAGRTLTVTEDLI
jgi:hypothetical protein